MRVEVRIERLVLDGLPIGRHDGPRVRAAVEKELARLLQKQGLRQDLRSSAAVPRLAGGSLELRGDRDPGWLGNQIARSVFGGIGRIE